MLRVSAPGLERKVPDMDKPTDRGGPSADDAEGLPAGPVENTEPRRGIVRLLRATLARGRLLCAAIARIRCPTPCAACSG